MNYHAYVNNFYEAIDQQNMGGARSIFDQIFPSCEKKIKAYLIKRQGIHWLETRGIDIVQSVGLKIWQLLLKKRYDLNKKTNFISWCIGITINKYKDHWKKPHLKNEFNGNENFFNLHSSKEISPDKKCEQNENVELIMKKIIELPELQKNITLDKSMNMNGVETAKKNGITQVKASRLLKKARKSLSKFLLQNTL